MSDNTFNFEKALEELNAIVNRMEQGGLSLEESLSHFENGIALTRGCQKALAEAEQTVQILMEKNGEVALHNYETAE